MARFHREINVLTGVEQQVPYTPEEEAAADNSPLPPTDDEADTATLAAALTGGRFEKAIAEVLRTEINAVRAALPTPLPAKTKGQINAALKIAMRNGV